MYKKSVCTLCLLLLLVPVCFAKEDGTEETVEKKGEVKTSNSSEAKELSGMSIVGNDEAPKSLYIVPWKSSELGVETSLNVMLSANDVPVDRDVFMRQLDFYEVSTAKSTGDSFSDINQLR